MDQLRATFIAGAQTGLTAQEIFTDRVGEIDAFREGLLKMADLGRGSGRRPDIDVSLPRRNVMVYYGIGGIGKTTLSRQLERRLLDGSISDRLPKKKTAVRLDFGETGEFDVETILLRIRAGLGGIRRRWPAFDLAFPIYWKRSHPGESLPRFARRSPALRSAGDGMDFADQIQDTFAQFLTEVGLAWSATRVAASVASLAHERFARSIMYRRLSDGCPFFKPIVTSENPAEAVTYMPALLAWELGEGAGESTAPVIFMDTFEAISGRETREIEKIVQRIIFLMPTTMFVITTRSRLDWAELPAAGELDYVGTSRWPNLHFENQTEPRQHLIGRLSEQDCETFLSHALRREDGAPALGPELRSRVVLGSQGLPLYLDLSITQFLELSATGRAIDVEAFGGPMSSVVARIMRNLGREERNVLRGVSLLDAFDIDLARAASAGVDAVVMRFINSSLVVPTNGLAWPYALHRQLRESIQETDHDLRDAWSAREWRLAGERICDHLEVVQNEAREQRDRLRVAACFTQVVRIVVRFNDAIPRWVLESAQHLADVGMWRTLDVRSDGAPPPSSPAVALLEGLRGISLRRQGSLEDSVDHFNRALSTPLVDDQAREFLQLHRAHSVRNSGRYDEARHDYDEIARRSGVYAHRARLQLADLHLLRGEFAAALNSLEELPPDAGIHGEVLRIKGHVFRANGDFEAAESVYRQALALGRDSASPALEGKSLTNIAETTCWTDPARGEHFANEAIEFNADIGNQLEVLKAHVAKAIAIEGARSRREVDEALDLAESSSYRAGVIFALAARLFHQCREGDETAVATMREIDGLIGAVNVYQYWHEIAFWWLDATGLPRDGYLRPSFARARWLDGPESTGNRWRATLMRGRG